MKLSSAFFLFLAVCGTVAAVGRTPAETHRKILEAYENRDYAAAAAELENLRKADAKTFALNNYDYLLGRAAERRGETATAAAAYQAVAARSSVLREYALRRLAQLARSAGNLLLERTYLEELLVYAPDGLTAGAARLRLAQSHFESRNYETAIRLFGELQKSPGGAAAGSTPPEKTPRYRENLVFLGEAYLQSGRLAEAREAFTRLVANLPNPAQPDDFALAGAKGLDRLDAGPEFGRRAPALTDFNHLQRALVYQFNRDFFDARLHYRAIVENHPQSGLVPDALYQIGRTHAQEGEFIEAIGWFERVLEQFPETPSARDALMPAASAYARVGKPREAVTRYQRFIEKYADADNLDRAYLNIIDVLRDAGEDSEALKWTARTQSVFKGKLPEALALFAQLRLRVAQADWQTALADADRLLGFADLGGTRVPGGTNRAEVVFLKGLALESLQRYAEAVEVYLSIPDGRGEYYGWRATERLRELGADERAKSSVEARLGALLRELDAARAGGAGEPGAAAAMQSVLRLTTNAELRAATLENLRAAYRVLAERDAAGKYRLPNLKMLEFGRREVLAEKRAPTAGRHQQIADELLFLGLYDEGTPELEKAEAEKRAKKAETPGADYNYTLAHFYRRGEMAHRAAGFIEPLWRGVAADYQIELIPREQAVLLYPAPYPDALLEHAPPRGVDPRFVLSVMRQESRFRADVKSNAAARGLMQFISTTSDRIARELGRENFRQDELYHPPTAILFGAQYLANLYRDFPGGHAAVAASYNGGEDNVRRWVARSKSDRPDRYVPEIVFSQSKDYAYKVLANYRMYQTLYDENLRPR